MRAVFRQIHFATGIPRQLLFLVAFLTLFNQACKEPDLGKIEYALRNASQVPIAFKVRLTEGANASIIEDSVVIGPGEELVMIRSHTVQEPVSIIQSIETWDSKFKEKYKDINVADATRDNDRFTWTLTMPNMNTAEITSFNHSVELYMNATMLFGFYPKVEYPRTTYFFKTSNYFEEVFKTQTPASNPNATFRMVDVFGSTMIGYDAGVYSGKTLFIRSTDNGVSWNTLFEFGFNTSDDAFMTADFVNELDGWFFNYKTVFNGHYANTYATDVYRYDAGNIQKIATVDDYCFHTCKFLDENTGYALANTTDNVIPAGQRNTYLFKTVDGGVTWSDPILVSDSYVAAKFFRLDNGKLIVFMSPSNSMDNFYFVSTNDGETWEIETAQADIDIRDLYFVPDGTGYIKTGTTGGWSFQNVGDVYKTTNGGATWEKITGQINGSTVWFFNKNIGYLQDLIYGHGQILYITKDGGDTWKEVLYPYGYLTQ